MTTRDDVAEAAARARQLGLGRLAETIERGELSPDVVPPDAAERIALAVFGEPGAVRCAGPVVVSCGPGPTWPEPATPTTPGTVRIDGAEYDVDAVLAVAAELRDAGALSAYDRFAPLPSDVDGATWGATRPAWADDINLAEKRGHRLRPVYAPGRKTLVCENCGAAARSSELGTECPKRGS